MRSLHCEPLHFRPWSDHATRGRVPAHCGEISQVHPSTAKGTKRPMREGSDGIRAALSPLVVMPSKPAVWAHIACPGPLPLLLPTTTVSSFRKISHESFTQSLLNENGAWFFI